MLSRVNAFGRYGGIKIFSGGNCFHPRTLLFPNLLALQRFDGNGARGDNFLDSADNFRVPDFGRKNFSGGPDIKGTYKL